MSSEFNYEMAAGMEFRDMQACKRARAIKREDIDKHPNQNFNIRVIEDQAAFQFAYVMDLVTGRKRS